MEGKATVTEKLDLSSEISPLTQLEISDRKTLYNKESSLTSFLSSL